MNFSEAFLVIAAMTFGFSGSTRSVMPSAGVSTACGLVTRAEAAAARGASVPVGSEKIADVPLGTRSIKAKYCFYGSEVVIDAFVDYEQQAALIEAREIKGLLRWSRFRGHKTLLTAAPLFVVK